MKRQEKKYERGSHSLWASWWLKDIQVYPWIQEDPRRCHRAPKPVYNNYQGYALGACKPELWKPCALEALALQQGKPLQSEAQP